MNKLLWAAAVSLAALLLNFAAGDRFGHLFKGMYAAAQETLSSSESDPPDPENPAPEAAGEAEDLPLVTGPRPQPAVLEGSRDKQRRPASAGQFARVFGDWGRGGWSDVLDEPRNGAARRSQALIGDQVEVVDQKDGGRWSQVKLVAQGDLTGWVRTDHLTRGSPANLDAWERQVQYLVVRAPGVPAEGELFLPFGAILPQAPVAQELRLLLPDGRRVVVEPGEVRRVDRPLAVAEALEQLRGFREIPFQNGGNTAQAMDSSGLIFLAFRVMGVSMPRQLEELLRFGTTVSSFDQARAGDVVFFSTFNPEQPRPVVLLDDRRTFIEAYPARGVSFGRVEQLRNRTILAVRRYG